MLDKKSIISAIKSRNNIKNYKFADLYRNFYNSEFYSDKLDQNEKEILIKIMRERDYSRFLSSENNLYRDNIEDIVYLFLNLIFEPEINKISYRINNPHTCLLDIKYKFQEVSWWIKIDINDTFDNMDLKFKKQIMSIIREKIKDLSFLNLVKEILFNVKLCFNSNKKTFLNTERKIESVFFDILFSKYDKFLDTYSRNFIKGETKKKNKQYQEYQIKLLQLKQKIKKFPNNVELKLKHKQIITEFRKEKLNGLTELEVNDPDFKRMYSIRYGNTILIGIEGNNQDVNKFISENKLFLTSNYKFKNVIINKLYKNKPIIFLNYEIIINSIICDFNNKNARSRIQLCMPFIIRKNFILENNFGKHDNRGNLKPTACTKLMNMDYLKILIYYNNKIKNICDYYKLANNISKFSSFIFIARYSFLKTIAGKKKTSIKKLITNNKTIPSFSKNKKIGYYTPDINIDFYSISRD